MTKTTVQQFSFITPLFSDTADTLKTKLRDVVGCIFDVECTVGGFLILKQIIIRFLTTSYILVSKMDYSLEFELLGK
jgi:hypothetical protein